jgi:hypothetical protein
MADHDRGVQVQHQTVDALPGRHGRREPVAGLGQLRPGDLPGRCPRRPQPGQTITVQIGQNPPRGRVRRHRTEQVRLVTQDRHVRDRLATIGQHHRQVQRDPAWVVATAAPAQARQCVAEVLGQPGRVRDVGQQSRPHMAGDTPTIRGDRDPRACSGNLHSAGAFPGGLMRRRQPSSSQQGRHFRVHDPPVRSALLKGRG